MYRFDEVTPITPSTPISLLELEASVSSEQGETPVERGFNLFGVWICEY
jgi:hypothetical protein